MAEISLKNEWSLHKICPSELNLQSDISDTKHYKIVYARERGEKKRAANKKEKKTMSVNNKFEHSTT